MIVYSNLSKMEHKILPATCLEGNYRDSLGEFTKQLLNVVLEDQKVKHNINMDLK